MEIDFENHASASNVANPGSADNPNIADIVNADTANNAAIAETAENRGNTGSVGVVGAAGGVGAAFCLRQERVDLIEFGWSLLLVLKNGQLSAIRFCAAKQVCFFEKVGLQRGGRAFGSSTIAFSFFQLLSMSRLSKLGCLSNAIFDPKTIRSLCHCSWKWSSHPGFRTLTKLMRSNHCMC
jgi:hypothetical protein